MLKTRIHFSTEKVDDEDKQLKELLWGIVALLPTYGLCFLSLRKGIHNDSVSLELPFNSILFYDTIILKINGLLIILIM